MNSALMLETKSVTIIESEIRKRLVAKSFFGLSGDMGAGKTSLIAGLLVNQNVVVSSPTFALYNSYQALGLTVVHVDLYRLNTPEEIESAGFWDLFADPQSVIFTEWVERTSWDDIPLDWQRWLVTIKIEPDFQRAYSLHKIS